MCLHRRPADPELDGDPADRRAPREARDDFAFPLREGCQRSVAAASSACLTQSPDGRRQIIHGKDELACDRSTERARQTRRLPIVREDAARSRNQGELHVPGGRLSGRDHHRDVRFVFDRRKDQETPAVTAIQVHHHEVGSCLSEALDDRRLIGERTEHVEARASAEGDQEILSELHALGDHEDPDGVHHSARNIGISEAEDELFREGWDTRLMNRLGGETSPYLLQHAGNPVDWSPWDEAALRRARIEDRPIFLSIGYAACHWCHVMERESFEDVETAAFLNANFVPIKVDREERPDLDAIYMDAVQAMTGQGGWPLSAFLTPDGRPFFAGTYFPKEAIHGTPSFRQVLEAIAEAWRDRRDDVERQGGQVVEAISRTVSGVGSEEPLTDEISASALAQLRAAFDERWGGFGAAPKFPQPMTLEFVLRMAVRGKPDALEMLTTTLDRIASGGIYDHVGGGFARYSTDATWHVPHFEKMLYDNAQLAQLYVRAWLLTRDDRYRRVATDTLDYLLREMHHPEGSFYSSQDADSEGVEGKFFTWTWEELVGLIGADVAEAFGATPAGNWEGTNVLWLPGGSEPSGLDLSAPRRALFEAREARVRPGTDDKVLTAWNAMAIAALAEAGRAFGEPRFIEAAEGCARFILENLRRTDGRLLRSWREGVPGRAGFCDDHALLASAYFTLFSTTGSVDWFREATGLLDALVDLFLDAERGGFFQTGSDDEQLVLRPKELYDNAVPSGNSVAAEVLQRVALLSGDPDRERVGVSAIRLLRDVLGRGPTAFGHALCALDLYLGPSREVAIVGDLGDERTRSLVNEVHRARFLPNAVVAVGGPRDEEATEAVALLRDRPQMNGLPTAYVCERFTCRLPVTTPEDLAEQLAEI